jgi:diguanylate cyclase (GGDEF)-like protein
VSHLAALYALAAGLLGLGAPMGALLLRIAGGVSDVRSELIQHGFFYGYQLLGTVTVFGIAGWIVGRRTDRYRSGRDLYRNLAEHDALTRLPNARAFADHHHRSVQHARRYGEPLSLLLIDVDGLKSINDTFGHSVGSAALVRVADVLRECKRNDDVAARWGGDEFALLMRGADAPAAQRQAEAILTRLRERPLPGKGGDRGVSVTIGISTIQGTEPDTLLERADQALYSGKAAGRDRAVAAYEARPGDSTGSL